MISADMERWLVQHFGGFDYPRETGEDTYAFRLQDFTDAEIRKAVKQFKPRWHWELIAYLRSQTEDEDVIAHLFGDRTAESRRQSIEQIRKIQEELHG